VNKCELSLAAAPATGGTAAAHKKNSNRIFEKTVVDFIFPMVTLLFDD
ncbi:unnamed protein product, partial [Pylaiella littoralis]